MKVVEWLGRTPRFFSAYSSSTKASNSSTSGRTWMVLNVRLGLLGEAVNFVAVLLFMREIYHEFSRKSRGI